MPMLSAFADDFCHDFLITPPPFLFPFIYFLFAYFHNSLNIPRIPLPLFDVLRCWCFRFLLSPLWLIFFRYFAAADFLIAYYVIPPCWYHYAAFFDAIIFARYFHMRFLAMIPTPGWCFRFLMLSLSPMIFSLRCCCCHDYFSLIILLYYWLLPCFRWCFISPCHVVYAIYAIDAPLRHIDIADFVIDFIGCRWCRRWYFDNTIQLRYDCHDYFLRWWCRYFHWCCSITLSSITLSLAFAILMPFHWLRAAAARCFLIIAFRWLRFRDSAWFFSRCCHWLIAAMILFIDTYLRLLCWFRYFDFRDSDALMALRHAAFSSLSSSIFPMLSWCWCMLYLFHFLLYHYYYLLYFSSMLRRYVTISFEMPDAFWLPCRYAVAAAVVVLLTRRAWRAPRTCRCVSRHADAPWCWCQFMLILLRHMMMMLPVIAASWCAAAPRCRCWYADDARSRNVDDSARYCWCCCCRLLCCAYAHAIFSTLIFTLILRFSYYASPRHFRIAATLFSLLLPYAIMLMRCCCADTLHAMRAQRCCHYCCCCHDAMFTPSLSSDDMLRRFRYGRRQLCRFHFDKCCFADYADFRFSASAYCRLRDAATLSPCRWFWCHIWYAFILFLSIDFFSLRHWFLSFAETIYASADAITLIFVRWLFSPYYSAFLNVMLMPPLFSLIIFCWHFLAYFHVISLTTFISLFSDDFDDFLYFLSFRRRRCYWCRFRYFRCFVYAYYWYFALIWRHWYAYFRHLLLLFWFSVSAFIFIVFDFLSCYAIFDFDADNEPRITMPPLFAPDASEDMRAEALARAALPRHAQKRRARCQLRCRCCYW